jgi:lipopolysaccharide/colanic/teichoic acid biosynthesis glycosyltransferase
MIYKLVFKRLIDFLFALFILILTSPILLVTIILLYLLNNKAVFFFQERPGLNAKPFKIIKFKTMNDKKDANGKLLSDKERLTFVGKKVRSFSIDELPQMINVLKGDMSIIGPRPLLMRYLPLYSKEQAKRHFVKPGITGLAQVNGRNNISWEKKFEWDIYYVENLSFLLDVKVLILTIAKVIRREGISAENQSTTLPFTGN